MSDVLDNAVPGAYAPGSAGYVIGTQLPLLSTVASLMSTLVELLQTGGATSSFSQGLLSAIQVGRDSQNYEVVVGEDYTIPVVMNPPTDISTWAITFTVRDKTDTVVLTKTVGDGITVTSGANGVFEIAVSATDNATIGNFKFDTWRTDSGNKVQINFGEFVVSERERA